MLIYISAVYTAHTALGGGTLRTYLCNTGCMTIQAQVQYYTDILYNTVQYIFSTVL